MEGEIPQSPEIQNKQPEVEGVSQTPQQPPTVPQTPPKPTSSTKLKKHKKWLKIIILIGLLIIGIILISGFIQKECKVKEDCPDKTGFTKDCINNSCSYSQIIPCRNNNICEQGESYKTCPNDCIKSGYLKESEIWAGEILITGSVDFDRGASLTINPGTKVLFEKNQDIAGTDWTRWADEYIKGHNDPTGAEGYRESHFSITAKIIAVGTKEAPIIFTSAQIKKEYADWNTLVLLSDSRLENVELSFAHNGVNVEGENVIIKNSKIHDSLWSCIDVWSTGSVIEGNEIYHCWHQAIGFKTPGPNIARNNYIHDANSGVNCEFGANPEIKNNRFISAPYSCPKGQNNEIIEGIADTEGGTYNGVLIYPSNRNK